MKKIIGMLAVLGVMMGSSVFALDLTYGGETRPYTGPEVSLILNDEKFVADETQMPPIILDNRTLVPVREVFEKLGGIVEWNAEARRVIVRFGDKTIELMMDHLTAIVNGEEIALDVPAKIINSKTMVPVRFISEHADLKVDWEATTHTVTVSKKNKESGDELLEENKTMVSKDMQTIVEDLLAKSGVTFRMPMTIKIEKEAAFTFIGLTEEQFSKYIVDSVVHESGIMPSNSSLCVVKLSEEANVAELKQAILDNCDPRKWICMGADKCVVIESGRYVMLMMGSEEECAAMQKAFTEHFGSANVGAPITK